MFVGEERQQHRSDFALRHGPGGLREFLAVSVQCAERDNNTNTGTTVTPFFVVRQTKRKAITITFPQKECKKWARNACQNKTRGHILHFLKRREASRHRTWTHDRYVERFRENLGDQITRSATEQSIYGGNFLPSRMRCRSRRIGPSKPRSSTVYDNHYIGDLGDNGSVQNKLFLKLFCRSVRKITRIRIGFSSTVVYSQRARRDRSIASQRRTLKSQAFADFRTTWNALPTTPPPPEAHLDDVHVHEPSH